METVDVTKHLFLYVTNRINVCTFLIQLRSELSVINGSVRFSHIDFASFHMFTINFVYQSLLCFVWDTKFSLLFPFSPKYSVQKSLYRNFFVAVFYILLCKLKVR